MSFLSGRKRVVRESGESRRKAGRRGQGRGEKAAIINRIAAQCWGGWALGRNTPTAAVTRDYRADTRLQVASELPLPEFWVT